MLIDEEQIRALTAMAINDYENGGVWSTAEKAIRLAIAETAEACAKVCERLYDEMEKAGGYEDFADALDCADAIRDAARGGWQAAKGAK